MKSTISLQDLLTSAMAKELGGLAEELFSSDELPTIAVKTAAFRHFGDHGIMLTLPPSLEGAAVSSFVVRAYDIAAGTDTFEQCIDALLARAYGVAVIGVPASTRQRRWQISWYDNMTFVETGRALFHAVRNLLEKYHNNQQIELPQTIECRFQGWGLGAAMSLAMAAAARKIEGCEVLSIVAGGIPNNCRRRYRRVITALRPIVDQGSDLASFNVKLARLYTESKPDLHGRWHRVVKKSTPRSARGLYRWLRFPGFQRQMWRLLMDPGQQASRDCLEAGFDNVVVVTAERSLLASATALQDCFAAWQHRPHLLEVEEATNELGLLPLWALYAESLIEGQAALFQENKAHPDAVDTVASA